MLFYVHEGYQSTLLELSGFPFIQKAILGDAGVGTEKATNVYLMWFYNQIFSVFLKLKKEILYLVKVWKTIIVFSLLPKFTQVRKGL